MNGPRKVLCILFAIIAFIVTVVAYLLVKQHYILATSILLLCGLGVFLFIQQIAAQLIQQEILNYLDQNNNVATVVEIINFLHHSSKKHDKATITDLTLYSFEKLIQKNMVVRDQGRVRKVT